MRFFNGISAKTWSYCRYATTLKLPNFWLLLMFGIGLGKEKPSMEEPLEGCMEGFSQVFRLP